MHFQEIDGARGAGNISCARAAALFAAAGGTAPGTLAAEILATAGAAAPLAQCVLLAYECGRPPRLVAGAGGRGERALAGIVERYARDFYRLDGNQRVMAERRTRGRLVLHRQSRQDIAHEGYRAACYDAPRVDARVALMLQPAEDIWLSLNLYKDRGLGDFCAAEIEALAALGPLLAQAARQHYLIAGQLRQGVPQLMLARLRGACRELSPRELDVLRGILSGRSAAEIAAALGIKPASVVTYRKRAYRRLGVSSQAELFALGLSLALPAG